MNKHPINLKNNKIIYLSQYFIKQSKDPEEELIEQKIIDFLMVISHFVVADGQEALGMLTRRVNNSANRLNVFNSNCSIWPSTCYLLDVEDKKEVSDLNQWFRRTVQVSHS